MKVERRQSRLYYVSKCSALPLYWCPFTTDTHWTQITAYLWLLQQTASNDLLHIVEMVRGPGLETTSWNTSLSSNVSVAVLISAGFSPCIIVTGACLPWHSISGVMRNWATSRSFCYFTISRSFASFLRHYQIAAPICSKLHSKPRLFWRWIYHQTERHDHNVTLRLCHGGLRLEPGNNNIAQ